MNHFDVLANFAESKNCSPRSKGLIHDSALFITLEANAIGDAFPTELVQECVSNFFLPFPICAVSVPGVDVGTETAVLIADTKSEQHGWEDTRFVLSALTLPDGRSVVAETIMRVSVFPGESRGWKIEDRGTLLSYRVSKTSPWVTERQETMVPDRDDIRDLCSHQMSKALQIFALINTPNRFVVESQPVNPRKTAPGRITRSPDRVTYTLLTVPEIQKLPGMRPEAPPDALLVPRASPAAQYPSAALEDAQQRPVRQQEGAPDPHPGDLGRPHGVGGQWAPVQGPRRPLSLCSSYANPR